MSLFLLLLLLLVYLMHYLLVITDGQYLASRLSKNISQQSSKLKQLLTKYNSYHSTDVLTWAEVIDLSSSHWWHRGASNHQVPKTIQLEAIKNHHLMLRAEEEMELIEKEMQATVSFYIKDWQELMHCVKEQSALPYTRYNSGALVALQLSRLRCEETLRKLVISFGPYIDLQNSLPLDQFIILPSHVCYSSMEVGNDCTEHNIYFAKSANDNV